MKKPRRIIAAIALAASLLAASAAAQTIDTTQPLSFGSIMLRNNTARHSVLITPQGVVNYSPAIIQQTAAQEGIYLLQGFPPNTALSLDVNPNSVPLVCACATPVMTLDNFTFFPSNPSTDPAGNATIRLGARMRTSGNRAAYGQGDYTGQITIIVNN